MDEYAINYAKLLDAACESSMLVLGPPPVHEQGDGVRRRTNAVIGTYSEAAAEVAKAKGAAFVRLMDLLADDGRHHIDDGLHLNDAA